MAVPALSIATVIMLRRVFLEPLVLFPNVTQQILAQLLCVLNFVGIGTSNVEIHWLVTLPASALFHKTRATALDLNLAPRLLLNVLHVGTSLSDNLGTEVEPRYRFQTDRNLFFGPFAAAKFVALDLFWLPAAESPFIH
jgi:hypothetical protein